MNDHNLVLCPAALTKTAQNGNVAHYNNTSNGKQVTDIAISHMPFQPMHPTNPVQYGFSQSHLSQQSQLFTNDVNSKNGHISTSNNGGNGTKRSLASIISTTIDDYTDDTHLNFGIIDDNGIIAPPNKKYKQNNKLNTNNTNVSPFGDLNHINYHNMWQCKECGSMNTNSIDICVRCTKSRHSNNCTQIEKDNSKDKDKDEDQDGFNGFDPSNDYTHCSIRNHFSGGNGNNQNSNARDNGHNGSCGYNHSFNGDLSNVMESLERLNISDTQQNKKEEKDPECQSSDNTTHEHVLKREKAIAAQNGEIEENENVEPADATSILEDTSQCETSRKDSLKQKILISGVSDDDSLIVSEKSKETDQALMNLNDPRKMNSHAQSKNIITNDSPGVIILTAGQHVTYTVAKDFTHYLYIHPDAKVTFKSQAKGASININKHIWGGGAIEISCNATVNGNFWAPQESEINSLPRYQYLGKTINETIL